MRRNAVFVDTFHWLAEINERDEWHSRSVAAREKQRGRQLVTSEEVLSEVLDFMSGSGPYLRAAAAATVLAILEDPEILVIEQSHTSFTSAMNLYTRRRDNRYSMTDCSSMHIMTSAGILDVLTHDGHFEQEGFNLLI